MSLKTVLTRKDSKLPRRVATSTPDLCCKLASIDKTAPPAHFTPQIQKPLHTALERPDTTFGPAVALFEPTPHIPRTYKMNQRGVTTLELLLVVVIIGILAMVTMTEYLQGAQPRLCRRGASRICRASDRRWPCTTRNGASFPSTDDAGDLGGLLSQLDGSPDGHPYI
jgi:prepilin-type N-terminal cleavage/methylation domain-containing protein